MPITTTPDTSAAILRLVDLAVQVRFEQIRPRLQQRCGGYRYDDLRCEADQLGPRFRVDLSLRLHTVPSGLLWVPPVRTVGAILRGAYDREIEAVWHEAAESAWLDREFARELV